MAFANEELLELLPVGALKAEILKEPPAVAVDEFVVALYSY